MPTYTIPGLTFSQGSLPANAGVAFNGGWNSTPSPSVRTVPQGQVLAASTGPTTRNSAPVQQTPQAGQNGYVNPNTQGGDQYAGVRNDISSAWDTYLSGLSDTGNYLNDQQKAQTGIADSQLNQGIETANSQKAKSLKDIADTTRNAFQAGNNYLGSLGAGDSSAANQYSFAINQQANKQTGDLNNFVGGQIKDLQSQHDQQVQSIASWFAQQQAALKQQIAQGGLNKGQDLANLSKGILDQAIQATNALKSNTQNQYNALVSWAAGNSANLGQLQSNIAGVNSQFAPGQVQTVGGQGGQPIYGGGGSTKTDLFGNPIR